MFSKRLTNTRTDTIWSVRFERKEGAFPREFILSAVERRWLFAGSLCDEEPPSFETLVSRASSHLLFVPSIACRARLTLRKRWPLSPLSPLCPHPLKSQSSCLLGSASHRPLCCRKRASSRSLGPMALAETDASALSFLRVCVHSLPSLPSRPHFAGERRRFQVKTVDPRSRQISSCPYTRPSGDRRDVK